ncbi:MAG: protein kinase [Planctomycetes bacterium]|nr:protein kinase [Planctomycetota bacterium]
MKICLACEGVTNTAAQRCGHCGAWMLPTEAVHYPVRRGESESGNPLLGTVVDGKYRLQAVLGRGGLGTVFQAMHTGSLMTVALKLLHPRFAEHPEYRRALLPEARRAATVTHERCARLLDVGEAEDGTAYLAMELVEGDTLETVMRPGRLQPSQAVEVLLQIAEALAAIHAAGLVHCDLAPRNVMVAARNGDLRVKVLDFGIARSVTMAGSDRMPGSEFAGFVNPVFSAPELLANQDVDRRADVYSFGSLAWLLLTGSAPVDDSDSRRAALAVANGDLRPWPAVPGVPRRLQRLVQRCVARDPDRRPDSAAALRHELERIRGRRPAMARGAVVAAALAVMVTLASTADRPPAYLRPRAGSALVVSALESAAATTVQHLSSARLRELTLHFGGFPPQQLRVDVLRNGVRLLGSPQQPEVDAARGELTLANAQPGWRELLEGLVQSSRDGPVDVSFMVPGREPLGSARVRVDDEAPQIESSLALHEAALTGDARLVWHCTDVVGVASVVARVSFRSGRRLELSLPGPGGDFDLGAALAAAVGTVEPLGAGELTVVAADLAGNRGSGPTVAFVAADVLAPSVVAVTGPGGEASLPTTAASVQFRVVLSAAEPGCTLRLLGIDRAELARVPLAGTATTAQFDLPLQTAGGTIGSGPCWFVVEDALGNRTEQQVALTLRRRDLQLDVQGEPPHALWVGDELVVADTGGEATIATALPFRIVRAAVELSRTAGTGQGGPLVRLDDAGAERVRLHVSPLPPGGHELRLEFEDREGLDLHQEPHRLPLRVLPDAIEVRVPAAKSRFLPGLLQAGVLTRRSSGFGEGPGWRLDPALRPYLRGTLWVGADDLVPLPLAERDAAGDPLLPDVVLVPGRNVFALELRDVLDRPARVIVGDGASTRRSFGGRTLDVVADFWWHDAVPEPIGEELLVEFGQPARLRLRFPLPFRAEDQNELRLGIAQSEVVASVVAPAGDGAVVSFELPFAVWSVAAQLSGRSREEFPDEVERRLDAYVSTPAGRQGLVLRLRTTRSTLRPLELGELAELPPALAAIRLLPVLAPAGPFAEPVPPLAPPRALFRPQQSVAVRNIADLLLQDREFGRAAARALVAGLARWIDGVDRQRLVHHDDPLGVGRLQPAALLGAAADGGSAAGEAAADRPLTGVDFFQAYTLCRLLGLAVGGDPDLFRLPLGCELELAAYAGATRPSCHGVGAAGRAVSMPAFLDAAPGLERGEVATSDAERRAGDVVPTSYGVDFVGLDFGVREWVADVPHVPDAALLLREWISDHAVHLARVSAFARGTASPPPDLEGPLRMLGVVRGLALGELEGLIGGGGIRLDARILTVVPDTVPGVLRTEQLARDGRDLLTSQRDPRLLLVGFRIAGTEAMLSRLRGWR